MAPEALLVSAGPGELRLALVENGRVAEFVIDRGEGWPGDCVLGRVVEVNRRSGLAFLDIGTPVPGVLPAAGMKEGEAQIAQIKAAARGDKGPELTRNVTLEGALAVFTPTRPGLSLSRKMAEAERARLKTELTGALPQGEGLVVRSAAAGAAVPAILSEAARLRGLWQRIVARAATDKPPCFLFAPHPVARILARHAPSRVLVDDTGALAEIRAFFPAAEASRDVFALFDAADELERALCPTVALAGGACLTFGVAAGLNVVDVDAGSSSPEEANRVATAEIARQIRLRGLAGRIIVDAVPMRRPGALAEMMAALKGAVATDPTPTHVIGRTPLGAVEMTRERGGPTLAEVMLASSLPARNAATLALEGLRALVDESLVRPEVPLLLAAGRAVNDELRRRPAALAEATRKLGAAPVLICADGVETFEVRRR